MGLDDVIGDDADKNDSSSDDSQDFNPENKEGPRYGHDRETIREAKSKQEWEEVIDAIENEMGLSISEVMNWHPKRQQEVLHKARLMASSEGTWTENVLDRETICIVCGHDCTHDGVVIEGEKVCKSHSANEVRTAIDKKNNEYE